MPLMHMQIFLETLLKALNNWRILHLKASSLKSYSFWRFFYLVTFETEEMHAIEITRQKFQVKQ